MTEKIVVLGSSNYTKPGLHSQRELNSRFTIKDKERYESAQNFVDGCFEQSEDYSNELLDLLKQLIRKTSWQEALACACWDMLDGMEGDANTYLLVILVDHLLPGDGSRQRRYPLLAIDQHLLALG